MQEQQEPSVNDILSSIRQILSNKIEDDTAGETIVENETISEKMKQPVSEMTQDFSCMTDVFLLTPQMRVDGGKSAENISKPISQSVEKSVMPQVSETDIKPMVQEWLDKNLPSLVEKIVAEEVRRIFNKR